MRDAVHEFMEFNRPFAQRNPELLRLKVARMAEGPFAFFRGTFHLFARDVLDKAAEPLSLFTGGAELDLVGDIHSENFGTYKAADGVVHYDINDFDETTRGRFDFDVCREATSLFLSSRERKDSLTQGVQVVLSFLTAYSETLRRLLKKKRDSDLDVSENSLTQCPAVDELIQARAASKRPAFIQGLTEYKNGQRRLLRSTHYFNLPDDERAQAERLLADYITRRPKNGDHKDYYAIEDVCGRVAGIGSMGRFRYVVLVNGKGSADARNVLLEFKEARPSAYDLYRHRDADAAALVGRAERVVTVQRESQAASSPHLGFAVDGTMSFQAREVGPQDARVDTKTLASPGLFEGVARVQASLLARCHARAAMRAVGAANPLAEVSDADVFSQRVLSFALGYADIVQRDWTRFVGSRAEIDNVSSWAGK
jgi:uncharacterized protein (DUF2252 family)